MSLIVVTPDEPAKWPTGTVITVDPIYDHGAVVALTLNVPWKGHADVITARSPADVWAALTKLPTA